MKKGLNVTLLTVAIAVLAFQAMGRAPVIGDIQSPIVGSDTGVTAATPFVYIDAFDITAKASDDSTAAANIRWSYYYAGSTEVYRINDVNRVTVSDAAINNPGAALINGATKDPADPNTAATITIRNVKYAPIGGSVTNPTTSGIIDAMPVTLFASDGTTYSQKEVFFYTDNGGADRLSGEEQAWTPVAAQTTFPTGGGISWTWAYLIGTISQGSTSSGTAICIETAPLGMNYASYNSNWGIFSVSKDTVYRIRARINGTQTQVERSPFFDLVLGNFDNASSQGLNLFGADLMIFDNEGGANAPMLKTATSGTEYRLYWAPASFLNTTFNESTVWSTANANNRKMYMTFRIMDLNRINNADPLTADNDSGVLCLNDLKIDSIPYSEMQLENVWASQTTLSASNMQAVDYVGAVAFDGGKVRINSTGSASTTTYGNAYPGDATMDMGNFASYNDNYPVTWEANTLYKITWQWSAVDTNSATNPLDVIWSGMDCPSNEFILNSYVTSQEFKAAMPKTGTAQDYVAFFYTHNVSATTHNEWKRLRPRAEWANSELLSESASNGSYYIHGCKVEKVLNP